MHIIVDIREACHPQATGKGRWLQGVLPLLLQSEHRFTLLSSRNLPEEYKKPNVEYKQLPRGLRFHRAAATYVKKVTPDLYLSPTSYIVPWLIGAKVPCALVVHDFIAFRHEPHDRKATIIEKLFSSKALSQAHHIFCISESTKEDLNTYFPNLPTNNVSVVYAGAFGEPVERGASEPMVFTIGTLCPRKNQLRLIQAFQKLPDNLRRQYKLIIAGGRGWQDQEIVRLAAQTRGVEWKGYVNDDEYKEYLRTCTVLAYPSLYEGFGLPVLDALQAGVPVLTSNRGSLKEIVGNAALVVNPEDEEALTDGLERLLTDAALRQRLSEAGPAQAKQFSWQRTADLLLKALAA